LHHSGVLLGNGGIMSKPPVKFGQRANSVTPTSDAGGQRNLPGRIASGNETMHAASRAMPFEMAQKAANLARSGIRDVISDRQARSMMGRGGGGAPTAYRDGAGPGGDIQPPDERSSNLPVVISVSLAKSEAGFNPRWHMVRNLPGYQQEAIRGYGRSIFQAFTAVPIEDIQMIATAINGSTEVKLLMAWISENGVREDTVELDGAQVFGEYKADVQKWSCDDYSFLLVRDQAGHYVYGWHKDFDTAIDYEPPRGLPAR
jgi:hypothetical protein